MQPGGQFVARWMLEAYQVNRGSGSGGDALAAARGRLGSLGHPDGSGDNGGMARRPYRIARQEHLGDALDDLQRRGVLRWQWDYANSRAIYRLTLPSEKVRDLDTAAAERLAQRHYDDLGVRWFPVPAPGGQKQRDETLRRIAEV
jgi:hypothetical protein